ncbi:MAG: hypothetical protein HOP33_07095 [Verrucomicrobia bacterium]|nr:hypothetical protein [Verrucomicrobiota bacterium]
MRIFKLPAPVVAVILSVVAESLVFLVIKLFGIIGYLHFSALQDLYEQIFMWFHLPGAIFSERLAEAHFISHDAGIGLMIFIAVFQWWLIFLAAIWMFRPLGKDMTEQPREKLDQ